MSARIAVQPEVATVYRAAGRRWMTLEGACNAAARRKLNQTYRANGEDPRDIDRDRYAKIIRRLARLYRRAALRLAEGES